MAQVLGVGGVFFLCENPAELAQWYKDHLNFEIDPSFGGCAFSPKTMPENSQTVWAPFKQDSSYFEPSKQRFMINLLVDDLNAALAQVKAAGAQLVGDPESFDYGDFGWFMDPAGNKVELWQAK